MNIGDKVDAALLISMLTLGINTVTIVVTILWISASNRSK